MITQLGNSRLIYKQIKLSDLDFDLAINDVSTFIDQSPKLMKSNDLTYLYFFSKGSSEDFMESSIWVALEVVGFCSKDSLEDADLGTKDLNASSVVTFEGPISFSFEEVLKAEKKAREQGSFVDTWRICIDFNKTNGSVLQFWE